MKNLIFSISSILICATSFCQSPKWQWAKNAGSVYSDYAYSVTTDKMGNVYMTGAFSGTVVFGTDTLITTSVKSMYLVKYDNNGNVLWAKSSSGSNNQQANSVITDNFGNVFVAGNYSGSSSTFDGLNLINSSSYTTSNLFLLKYNSSGNILWAKTCGSGGTSSASISAGAIAVENSGNIFVIGTFSSSTITLGSVTLSNAGPVFKTDAFIAKYDTNGNVIWAKRNGGTNDDFLTSVTIDSLGDVFTVGSFLSNTLSIGSSNLINTGSWDVFIAKYDSNGNPLWARQMEGNNSDRGYSIATDIYGNIYVGGCFTSSVCNLDTITITSNCCTNNAYLAKLNTSGNAIWVKSIESTGPGGSNEAGYSVATDKNGNVFLAGTFNSNLIFGSSHLTGSTGTSYLFVGKYDSSGNEIWAKKVNGLNHTEFTPIATDTTGNVFTAGYYNNPNIQFSFNTLTSSGQTDIYLAKLDTVLIPPVYTNLAVSACSSYNFNGINYYTSGIYYQSFMSSSGGDSIVILDLTIDFITGFIFKNGAGLTSYDSAATYQWLDCNNAYLAITGETQQSFIGTVPGSYSVIVNKGTCLDTSFCYNLTCVAYYETSYDSILNSFTITVDSVTTATAAGYYWDFGDGTSSVSPSPSHTYTQDSIYNLCMKVYTFAGDSCLYCQDIGKDSLGNIIRNSGFTLNIINNNLSLNIDYKTTSTISIAPNPFSNYTRIFFDNPQNNSTIKMRNVLGKELKTFNFKGQELILEKDELPAGIYFLQIEDDKNEIVVKKIVVQ